jgi:2-methylaconitate cis-trans-isomerase PrpF
MKEIPCTFMRGGACKGVIFHRSDLPKDVKKWDDIFIQVMGSPDPKQVDGLGGGTSSNNKVVIVSPSEKEGIDVEYTTVQVIPDKPQADYKSNCGNMTSTVGPFAVDEGLVEISEPFTYVKAFNTNTEKVVEIKVPVENGRAAAKGTYKFAGVLGTAAELALTFKDPSGTVTGKLLPTGNNVDTLDIPGYGPIEMTIIDVASPLVIIRAKDIGLKGTELPGELNNRRELLELIRKIRGVASQRNGLVDNWEDAEAQTPSMPKVAFFSEAQDYLSMESKTVYRSEMDFCSRIISIQKVHNAYVFTGAIAMAVAANLKGSILNDILSDKDLTKLVRIGHPSGVMPVSLDIKNDCDTFEVEGVTLKSTARKIMKGVVYVNDY